MRSLFRYFAILTGVMLCICPVFSQSTNIDSLLRSHIELCFGIFMHFNMNTFSPGWGNDRVDPKLFTPSGRSSGIYIVTVQPVQ